MPRKKEAAPEPRTVTNRLPGVTVHLGDGRKLAFGESAEVSPELRMFLLERGQVK